MNDVDGGNEIAITKVFNAPVERVFAFFTDPELLGLWHTPNPDVAPTMSVELSVGGSYRFEMTDPAGKVHVAIGVYQEIVANEKLVFTWKWEGAPLPDTTVTILFKAMDESTQVSLSHTGFTDQDTMTHHNQGWVALLANLAKVLN